MIPPSGIYATYLGDPLLMGEQQAERDALYVESREELKQKYEFGRMHGVA